jgi:hypothetical protein
MIGDTFIYAPDVTKIQALQSEGMDALDNFEYVDMEVMLTLDFETLCGPENVEWSAGDPVIFDEEAGLCVLRVSELGLQFVLGGAFQLDSDQAADVAALRQFVAKHGHAAIYEVSTF